MVLNYLLGTDPDLNDSAAVCVEGNDKHFSDNSIDDQPVVITGTSHSAKDDSDPGIQDSAAECADDDVRAGDRGMPNDANSHGPVDNEDTVTNDSGGNGDSDPGILVSVAECADADAKYLRTGDTGINDNRGMPAAFADQTDQSNGADAYDVIDSTGSGHDADTNDKQEGPDDPVGDLYVRLFGDPRLFLPGNNGCNNGFEDSDKHTGEANGQTLSFEAFLDTSKHTRKR